MHASGIKAGKVRALALAMLLIMATGARAQTEYRDVGAWSSMTFPKGWKQAALDKVVKFKRDASVSGVEFRAGFAKSLKNGEMELPFVIVVAQPHSMAGLRLDDIEETYESEMRVPMFAGVQQGETEFYLGSQMIVHRLSLANFKGGDAKAIVYTYLTKNGFVHVACFDAAKRFEGSEETFDDIAGSVEIDPAQEFREARSRSSGGRFGRRGLYGAGGGIVTIILIALGIWARK
ncbi:MAG: hypothetical protein AB7G11_14615 [Phycisphaerales bacterium]